MRPPASLARVEVSPAETRVLVLLAEGLSNAEIAARLYLSETTVKTHVRRLGAKLGANGRAAGIVGAAYRRGLLTAGPARAFQPCGPGLVAVPVEVVRAAKRAGLLRRAAA